MVKDIKVKKPLTKRKVVSTGWPAWLETFEAGEHRYCDTTLQTYEKDRLLAHGQRGANRQASLKGKEYSVKLLTAIGQEKGDVRYLLCVSRTK